MSRTVLWPILPKLRGNPSSVFPIVRECSLSSVGVRFSTRLACVSSSSLRKRSPLRPLFPAAERRDFFRLQPTASSAGTPPRHVERRDYFRLGARVARQVRTWQRAFGAAAQTRGRLPRLRHKPVIHVVHGH